MLRRMQNWPISRAEGVLITATKYLKFRVLNLGVKCSEPFSLLPFYLQAFLHFVLKTCQVCNVLFLIFVTNSLQLV